MRKTVTPVSDRAVGYILSRRIEDLGCLTEDIIARAIGVSLPYLVRRFKRSQRITLRDFITREKIHTAIFLMEKEHDVSIEELARKLGFLKISQFMDIFKEYIAMDPLTYRALKRQRKPRLNIDH